MNASTARWVRRAVLPVLILGAVAAGFGLSLLWHATAAAPGQTHFERAVAFVRDEASGIVPNKGPEDPRFRYYAALSAMSYVQANLSSARYSLFARTQKEQFRKPGKTEICLAEGIGICGNHIQAFLDIMEALKVPARSVQLYFEDTRGERQSHIVAEVEWGGRWHMFDITWSFVAFGDDSQPLSYAEVRAGKPHRASINHNNPWFQKYTRSLDAFEYVRFEKGDIIVDGSGTVRPYVLERTPGRVEYSLLHIPNYVGTIVDRDGTPGTIVQEIELPAGFDTLTIATQRANCPGPATIAANGVAKPVHSGTVEFSGLRGTVRLTANDVGKTCFIVLKDIVATGGRQSSGTNR
jgi:hypothetical protein